MIFTGKLKDLDKNQLHFVHHKSHMDCPGHEPGLHNEKPATGCLSNGMAY
jgi:hypothetical protein